MSCGPGWFNFGSWDFFHECCQKHDEAYGICAMEYAEAYVALNKRNMLRALSYKEGADTQFYTCCREKAKERNFLIRPFTKARAEIYIALVVRYSQEHWMGLTKQNIQEIKARNPRRLFMREDGFHKLDKMGIEPLDSLVRL